MKETSTENTPGTRSTPPLDVEGVRADFPILDQRVHDAPLVYLDSAASSQKPQAVIDELARFYAEDYANIHRGVHTLSQRATARFEAVRQRAARLLGAAGPREIVFVRGTTEAINLVAHSYLEPRLEAGDEVLVSAMEHHSNIVPWQLVCERAGATVRKWPMTDRGELVMEELPRLLGPRTKLVAVNHVSNALGTINPVREITAIAHEHGVPVLVDGAQSVPRMAVDVQALGCDFYAFSSHKLYGPSGIGVLYARGALLEGMPPYQGGGEMIRKVSFEGTTFNDPPARFEAGTPDIVGVVGLGAAIDYLERLGFDAIAAHEHDLLVYADAALREVPGLTFYGEARDRIGLVSFGLADIHPHDIGTILDREGIAVRTGHHCAQPVMAHYGVAATARASFGIYTTRDEIDALVTGLHTVREFFDMTSLDLRALYQEVILDHSKSPRNFRELEGAEHHAEGFNPLCGDQLEMWVHTDSDGTDSDVTDSDVTDSDVIRKITFKGQGCAISTASASLLTQHLEGKTVAEARRIFERFQSMVTGDSEKPVEDGVEELGKLAVLAGVREFPVRVKCATLSWHTLMAALEGRNDAVSTEE